MKPRKCVHLLTLSLALVWPLLVGAGLLAYIDSGKSIDDYVDLEDMKFILVVGVWILLLPVAKIGLRERLHAGGVHPVLTGLIVPLLLIATNVIAVYAFSVCRNVLLLSRAT